VTHPEYRMCQSCGNTYHILANARVRMLRGAPAIICMGCAYPDQPLPQASENSPPNASASPNDEGTSTSSSDR
jgi:hypothetical protein